MLFFSYNKETKKTYVQQWEDWIQLIDKLQKKKVYNRELSFLTDRKGSMIEEGHDITGISAFNLAIRQHNHLTTILSPDLYATEPLRCFSV